MGVSPYNAVSSDLYQVLLHVLKWQYQPARHADSHSWRDSIVEHRDRIDRLCTRSPALRRHLPAMLAEEYPRARRHVSGGVSLVRDPGPERGFLAGRGAHAMTPADRRAEEETRVRMATDGAEESG